MTAKVVPIRQPAPKPPPTADELVTRVRKLAKDTENIGFDHPHTKTRMAERSLTMRQILETIRKGECVSGPTLDKYGDWRIKLKRRVAGRRVQVVVAVKEKCIRVVTVI